MDNNQSTTALSPEQVLEITQALRLKSVTSLTNEKDVMNDPKMANVVIKLLDGLDKQALGIKRIETDNKVADGVIANAAAIANIVRKSISENYGKVIHEEVVPPQLNISIDESNVVPGNTDINPAQLSYATFMKD